MNFVQSYYIIESEGLDKLELLVVVPATEDKEEHIVDVAESEESLKGFIQLIHTAQFLMSKCDNKLF
jgi:hypothetical protein